ncbi:MAG TPA: ABC transporter permease [Chloroflexota bacterium]|nr:ABC transporter permease [Chloroflexota bacterium]HUM68811.1 ABC transporter permease [Chloroflexota bacterium]
MLIQTRQLYQSRDLLFSWTGRNIRARYQQSALGWLWAIFQPAAQVAIFSIIFTRIVPVDTGDIPYPVFSYVAIVPWTLLASSLSDMSQSIVANMGLVTKIYFPREILPVAAMLARLMDFGVALGLLFILMLIFRVPFSPQTLIFLPLILIVQLLLIVGIGLGMAAANVFFRDVQSLLALGLQLWFYASPIIYPVSMVPEQLRTLYFLNPMAGILESYRDILIYQRLPGPYLLQAAIITIAIFLVGSWFFKRVEFRFADII